MSHLEEGAIKVIEIIGISNQSFEDAVQQAVSKASQSISGITGVEILRQTARVSNGTIIQYRVDVKLAFAVK